MKASVRNAPISSSDTHIFSRPNFKSPTSEGHRLHHNRYEEDQLAIDRRWIQQASEQEILPRLRGEGDADGVEPDTIIGTFCRGGDAHFLRQAAGIEGRAGPKPKVGSLEFCTAALLRAAVRPECSLSE